MLIVEDDAGIATQLARGLQLAGYETSSVGAGRDVPGWPAADVVLLDLGLPDVDKPLGRLSVKGAVRVATVLLRFVKVIVRVDVPSAVMVDGAKALPSVGEITVTGKLTVKVATSGAILLPLLVCNAPAGKELI